MRTAWVSWGKTDKKWIEEQDFLRKRNERLLGDLESAKKLYCWAACDAAAAFSSQPRSNVANGKVKKFLELQKC